jgi:hypothetical protein
MILRNVQFGFGLIVLAVLGSTDAAFACGPRVPLLAERRLRSRRLGARHARAQ